jgi:hypothetical protein
MRRTGTTERLSRRRSPLRVAATALVIALSAAAWASIEPAARAASLATLNMGSAGALEGNSGTRTIWLPATLSAASSSAASVHYATGSNTATSGSDFTAASGTLNFPAGATTAYVPVTVLSDTTTEPDELFIVTLSAPSGATLGYSVGTGKIINDDPSSGVQIGAGNATVVEGNVGTRTLRFAATLSAASTSTVSVHYATASSTATSGSDFTAASGTLTFAPGVTTNFVQVTVNGDTTFETSETFALTLSSPVGATLARATATGTIVNDDAGSCGIAAPHPASYTSVVVFAFENRTWSDVGLGFGTGMPYLHALGQKCSYFTSWTETDTNQNSLTQYTGQVTGARQAGTVDDCDPSATCSTQANNIFRQARYVGKSAINYVDGATAACSASGNADKHIPDLYMWGADDRSHCLAQVRPLTQFNPNVLPNFAFVTPTLCHDGHDCSDTTVDDWARANVQLVLNSSAYKAGKVAVFIWYDEDHPVPNMWITPTAHAGALSTAGAGYAGTLKAWEAMLALPCLANACTAPNMRTPANS